MNKDDWRMGSSIVEIYLILDLLPTRLCASGGTDRFLCRMTSGGPIFLCLKKDCGERQIKGAAAPLNPLGLIGTPFAVSVPDAFALVPRPNFNQGRRFAYPRPFVPTALPRMIERLPQPPDCKARTTLVIL